MCLLETSSSSGRLHQCQAIDSTCDIYLTEIPLAQCFAVIFRGSLLFLSNGASAVKKNGASEVADFFVFD